MRMCDVLIHYSHLPFATDNCRTRALENEDYINYRQCTIVLVTSLAHTHWQDPRLDNELMVVSYVLILPNGTSDVCNATRP